MIAYDRTKQVREMSKKNRKNQKIDLSSDASGFDHNPFAAALKGLELPAGPEESAVPSSTTEASKAKAWDLSSSPRLTLRCDTKMRRGRVVTLIEGIRGGDKEEMKELGKWLGKRLGCGAKVESAETILIQGDHRERLPELLTERGASEVRVLDF